VGRGLKGRGNGVGEVGIEMGRRGKRGRG